MPRAGKTLDDLVLVAATEITEGNLDRDFAAERLLVQVWQHEPDAFGLRGYEKEHPDANKLLRSSMERKGSSHAACSRRRENAASGSRGPASGLPCNRKTRPTRKSRRSSPAGYRTTSLR